MFSSKFSLDFLQNPHKILIRILLGFSWKSPQKLHNLLMIILKILLWFLSEFSQDSHQNLEIPNSILFRFSSEPDRDSHQNSLWIFVRILSKFSSESIWDSHQNPLRTLIRILSGFSSGSYHDYHHNPLMIVIRILMIISVSISVTEKKTYFREERFWNFLQYFTPYKLYESLQPYLCTPVSKSTEVSLAHSFEIFKINLGYPFCSTYLFLTIQEICKPQWSNQIYIGFI